MQSIYIYIVFLLVVMKKNIRGNTRVSAEVLKVLKSLKFIFLNLRP